MRARHTRPKWKNYANPPTPEHDKYQLYDAQVAYRPLLEPFLVMRDYFAAQGPAQPR